MRTGILTACLAALALAGCNPQPYVTPERLDRGLVLVLPGIEGHGVLNEAIARGLDEGGVEAAIELVDWTSVWGPMYTLRAEQRNRAKAEEIAQRILGYRFEHPDRPVFLVGHSGGGGMAVWIAERLPPGAAAEGLVLLAPALSPGYMLEFALRHTRRGIVSFHSRRDWLFLGMGTTVAGTLDGEHTASAGLMGFHVPEDAPPCYGKLYQVPWTQEMAAAGHAGGHLSSAAAGFVAAYVAPLLQADAWSGDLVEQLTRPAETAPAQ